MNLAVIAAIIRKDVKIYWISLIALSLVAAVIPFFLGAQLNEGQPVTATDPFGYVMMGALLGVFVAVVLQAILIVQQDNAADRSQDWRTRPVGPLNLAIAKTVLCVALIGVPAFAGMFVLMVLDGMPLGPALAASTPMLDLMSLTLMLMLIAWLSTGLVQALIVLVVCAVVQVIGLLSGVALPYHLLEDGARTQWIAGILRGINLLGLGGVALWLLLARGRRTWAWILFVTMIALDVAISLASPRFLLSAQRAVAGEGRAAQNLMLSPGSGICAAQLPPTDLRLGMFRVTSGLLNRTYLADIAVNGLEPGDFLRIDDVEAERIDESGKVVGKVVLFDPEAYLVLGPEGEWRLKQGLAEVPDDFMRLAGQPLSLRLRYQMTVLEPAETASAPVSQKWVSAPGISCRMKFDDPALDVRCSPDIVQPALTTVHIAGARVMCTAATRCEPNYAPALVKVFDYASPWNRTLQAPPGAAEPTLVVTTYRVRGHVRRDVTLPPAVLDLSPPCAVAPGLLQTN